MSLYNTLVVAVFSYGAQVCGPDFNSVNFQSAVLKSVVGVTNPTLVSLNKEVAQRLTLGKLNI